MKNQGCLLMTEGGRGLDINRQSLLRNPKVFCRQSLTNCTNTPTLNISMANFCRFFLWIVRVISFKKFFKSMLVIIIYNSLKHTHVSCILFILWWLSFPLWNIHINGQRSIWRLSTEIPHTLTWLEQVFSNQ